MVWDSREVTNPFHRGINLYIVPASDMHTLGKTLPPYLGFMSSLFKVRAIFEDFLCHR